MAALAPERLVFIDESAASTSLARLYGRCLRGQRLLGSAPAGHWLSCTMVAGVRLSGPFAPALIDGPMNGEVFRAWMEQFLVPALRPGDVVVLDNLGSHRVSGLEALASSAKVSLCYLPPYSPDLNPIEKMWSSVKSTLRRLAARSFDGLCDAMAEALQQVVPTHCQGYFRSCGYRIS